MLLIALFVLPGGSLRKTQMIPHMQPSLVGERRDAFGHTLQLTAAPAPAARQPLVRLDVATEYFGAGGPALSVYVASNVDVTSWGFRVEDSRGTAVPLRGAAGGLSAAAFDVTALRDGQVLGFPRTAAAGARAMRRDASRRLLTRLYIDEGALPRQGGRAARDGSGRRPAVLVHAGLRTVAGMGPLCLTAAVFTTSEQRDLHLPRSCESAALVAAERREGFSAPAWLNHVKAAAHLHEANRLPVPKYAKVCVHTTCTLVATKGGSTMVRLHQTQGRAGHAAWRERRGHRACQHDDKVFTCSCYCWQRTSHDLLRDLDERERIGDDDDQVRGSAPRQQDASTADDAQHQHHSTSTGAPSTTALWAKAIVARSHHVTSLDGY